MLIQVPTALSVIVRKNFLSLDGCNNFFFADKFHPVHINCANVVAETQFDVHSTSKD